MAYTINIFCTLHTLLYEIFTLSRDIPPRALTKFLESLCLSVLGNSRSIAILSGQQSVKTPRLHHLVWPLMADIMSKSVYVIGIHVLMPLNTLSYTIVTLSRDIPTRAMTKFLESLCLSVLGNSRSIAIYFGQQIVQTPRLHNLVWPWMADIMSRGVYMTGIGHP